MNTELATDYITRRVAELGWGADYFMRMRHLILQPYEKRTLIADNQLLMLTEPIEMIAIQSEFGVFDLAAFGANELQYEHQGAVHITNYGAQLRHVRFIQVMPKKTGHATDRRKV